MEGPHNEPDEFNPLVAPKRADGVASGAIAQQEMMRGILKK